MTHSKIASASPQHGWQKHRCIQYPARFSPCTFHLLIVFETEMTLQSVWHLYWQVWCLPQALIQYWHSHWIRCHHWHGGKSNCGSRKWSRAIACWNWKYYSGAVQLQCKRLITFNSNTVKSTMNKAKSSTVFPTEAGFLSGIFLVCEACCLQVSMGNRVWNTMYLYINHLM